MNFKMSAVAKAIMPLCSVFLLAGCNNSSSENNPGSVESGKLVAIGENQAAIYFKNNDIAKSSVTQDYSGYTLYVWNDESCSNYAGTATSWEKGLPVSGVDEELGAYWIIDINDNASQCVNFIPRDANNDKPLGDFNAKLALSQVHADGNYVFTKSGIAAVFPEYIPPLPANTLRLYLNMGEEDIGGMTLHAWNDANCDSFGGDDTAWDSGLPLTGSSKTYGGYWDIPLKAGSQQCVNVIPHRGDEKPLVSDSRLDLEAAAKIGYVAFTFNGNATVYYRPMATLPAAELSGASAHWLTGDILAMEAGASRVELLYAENAGIAYDANRQTFNQVDRVISAHRAGSNSWATEFPHLSELESWQLDFTDVGLSAKDLLKGQLIAVAYDSQDKPLVITQVQPAGALDALYASTAAKHTFGAVINSGDVQFALWAPTAQSVSLVKYGQDKTAQASYPMIFNRESGAWELTSGDFAAGDFYRYKVKVYHPVSKGIMEYEVTDPYSLSLSLNSEFSQVVDLNDPALKPDGWDELKRPVAQTNPSRFVIYESQVRDFSALDASTTHKGKFLAFTESDSVPVKHLKSLSESGTTHLHLLPIFDIATINEDPAATANIDAPFSKLCTVNPAVTSSSFGNYCTSGKLISEVLSDLRQEDTPDNPVVQQLNRFISETDGFNWGYDPYHYTVPEGSYATNAEGTARILELRQAIQAIKSQIGMNVVMDVVYNHTNAAGPESKTSVLDKIVPWYYQRLNPVTGGVENSTCCSNTAPERAMFEKLITDSLVVWARDYKIDSFRFDLMGHHPLAQMQRSLKAVQAVDPNTYFYGEGWNFGEVANDAQFIQATQPHLGGTGIGSFSDRLRDAVRGGGPFDGGEGIRQNQGFGNGAAVLPNEYNTVSRDTALHLSDLTRLGMAGNLKQFRFQDATGKMISGEELDYNGAPAGYAVDPTEIQNYVSKHDNQTLWDNHQYKIGFDVDTQTRVRMQAVSLATAMLGQGVPFTHMGVELLRSKSMQRDSYDSGDWFNRVDFTLEDNNWNKGLPRQDKDGDNYALINKVLTTAGTNTQPDSANMTQMVTFYKELASLRKHYPLITLGTGAEVVKRVDFHNTGKEQQAGLIVMSIDNGTSSGADLDTGVDGLVIVINATGDTQILDWSTDLTLSPLHTSALASAAAFADGQLSVPAWTPAVFEIPRVNDVRGLGIPVAAK